MTQFDTTLKNAGDVVMHERTTLVIYHRDGATVTHMEKDRPLVVGRAAPADVVFEDTGLSRQHARFTWDAQGIWVEDLGSTNGTKKNGEKITRTRVMPGDEITMGAVMVSVHIVSSIDEELRGFDGHDRFVAALADEITRARTFQRPFALMLVRSANARDGHVNRWAHRLRTRLRAVDRVGLYGPTAVLVVVPEATAESLRSLMAALAPGTPQLSCNAVTFPGDGSSPDELIAALQVTRRVERTASRDPIAHGDVVVKNAAMKQVMGMVKRLAKSSIAVLLHGETGSGKEVIARAIHDASARKAKPLRSINCAAIPQTLLESMLFGHDQGAFTGADKTSRGIFEQADGGTVLLDEIGELAAPAQAALLRVLETRKLTRVGGDKEIAVDVRLIAATHRDLEAMVAAGRFRQDLLYRLNTLTLAIPPLRERVDEIAPLAARFLKEANAQAGTHIRSIDPAAVKALESYHWPGNVRELRNTIERAVVLAERDTITTADLTERICAASLTSSVERMPVKESAELDGDYKEHVRRYEARLIVEALHRANGNQTEAAKRLGLPLRTLVHKIQTYGIKKKFDP